MPCKQNSISSFWAALNNTNQCKIESTPSYCIIFMALFLPMNSHSPSCAFAPAYVSNTLTGTRKNQMWLIHLQEHPGPGNIHVGCSAKALDKDYKLCKRQRGKKKKKNTHTHTWKTGENSPKPMGRWLSFLQMNYGTAIATGHLVCHTKLPCLFYKTCAHWLCYTPSQRLSLPPPTSS